MDTLKLYPDALTEFVRDEDHRAYQSAARRNGLVIVRSVFTHGGYYVTTATRREVTR